MNTMLLIVDPQIDFISGTLQVPDAAEKIKSLANYVFIHHEKYKVKVVTADWHPLNHCSFKTNGGQWPVHCVQNTDGAAIDPFLLSVLKRTSGRLEILHKGDKPEREEYSVFQNKDSSACLDTIIREKNITQIDICGIAGDICVLNTLKDGIQKYGVSLFNVLTDFCPSLDDGKAISQAIDTLCVKSL